MTDLRQQLRPASFRGLSFWIPEDGTRAGRRIVRHEYPGRDEPGHEDLGLSARNFNIRAIICGDNFMADAAALENALLKSGAGTLIHPHYGEVQIIVLDYQREHSGSNIGEIHFTITAEKYGKPLYPVIAQDTASGLTAAGDNAFGAGISDFTKSFQFPGLDFLTTDALGRVNSFTASLQSTLAHYGILNLVNGDWTGALDVLTGGVSTRIMSTYQDFVQILKPLSSRIVGSDDPQPATGRDAVTMMKALTAVAIPTVALSDAIDTASQATRVNNAASIDYLNRVGALAAAAQIARYADYESREEAIAIRSGYAAAAEPLQDSLVDSGWDDTASTVGLLLAALSRDVNERLGRLPKTVTFTPRAILPSYVIAQRIYGDDPASLFANADDIARRNNVRHPGFVPAAPIEVLIDG